MGGVKGQTDGVHKHVCLWWRWLVLCTSSSASSYRPLFSAVAACDSRFVSFFNSRYADLQPSCSGSILGQAKHTCQQHCSA